MTNVAIPLKKYRRIGVGVVWDRDRQRILIDRRLPEGELAGYWEFPGGKIEPDEDAAACIKREVQEELAIEVEVGDHLITIDHEYETLKVSLIVHHCQHIMGEPQAIACSEILWVTVDDLDRYQLPEANYQIVKALRNAI
ncbi:MAG: 8-oxo-dGTP diphosphatase MutT [Pseudanabaena sp.]|jgi:mutator protein MutT|nr:8-oxo-dGTP diphosphatase MutT [Pseudanabaena sp. M051S1SP1A06QC]MCA6603360.1 8-oxo-dGTP diphosphatase MutT [Pseudanabaena sp. M007S1SP1A06QC]MCA6613953.1 8-oxo-dGTP diphosphatase MutT [Pseudanabaena sp. M090S1SP1A06QC]MCA6621108.1 8-oxo-dGTP diphosphatase MutT [Pseudanabaena sp. M165S2SP1A06QC]MCE2976695.1 8-oxo-dGTP diphosphatase MutT [Pseudanabaena sp. CoA8_M7]